MHSSGNNKRMLDSSSRSPSRDGRVDRQTTTDKTTARHLAYPVRKGEILCKNGWASEDRQGGIEAMAC